MNKYKLSMKTIDGVGTEYVYVESLYENFERYLKKHNLKYQKYNFKTNQDKEIERLNRRVKECEEAYLRTRHQYSELENKYLTDEHIINELEKWLNEEINNNVDGIKSFSGYQCKRTLDKLNELKGDSSNE